MDLSMYMNYSMVKSILAHDIYILGHKSSFD